MKKKPYRHLSFEERFVIEVMHQRGMVVRRIAEFLKRSPNTIAREITKNTVKGAYTAEKARQKASFRRWRAKGQCLKVAMSPFLAVLVEEKLEKKWSPKQISGHLKREYGITCSGKAMYKFAESRGLNHLLFWGWNHHKGGRKRGHWKRAHDGRRYIEERPLPSGVGHFEVDFIVSRDSAWVENTNRWIRCFVPKRRDIGTVTQEEMDDILSFLNDRPRECLGFVSPREYYQSITASVLLRG
jgi:IS30 family transposase